MGTGDGVGRPRGTGRGVSTGVAGTVEGGTSIRTVGAGAGATDAVTAAPAEETAAVVAFGTEPDRESATRAMPTTITTSARMPSTRPTPAPARTGAAVRRVVGPGGGIVGAGRRADAGTVGVAATGSDAVGTSASPSSSARTKAPALAQRSSGFLAMPFSSARTSGSGTGDAGGIGIGSVTWFISTATGVSAAKGTRPVR